LIYLKKKKSKEKYKYIIKQSFQNVLFIEDGFFNLDPLKAALKIFPSGWNFKS
jgi:hypothetical protein